MLHYVCTHICTYSHKNLGLVGYLGSTILLKAVKQRHADEDARVRQGAVAVTVLAQLRM